MTRYLYLDSQEPTEAFGKLQAIKYTLHRFSGGEYHLTIDQEDLDTSFLVYIVCRGTEFNLIALLQAIDILNRNKVRCLVYMPYLYYSRQDRATTPNSASSLELLLNVLKDVEALYTYDVHSSRALEMLPSVLRSRRPINFLQECASRADFIIAPDKGATEKIYDYCTGAGISLDRVITATKNRDPATGKLSSPEVKEAHLSKLNGKSAVIFDDICDGGYTFIQLADLIKSKVKVDLDLAVSHGIFSKGCEELLSRFNNIYTTDSIPTKEKEVQVIYKITKD